MSAQEKSEKYCGDTKRTSPRKTKRIQHNFENMSMKSVKQM